MSPRKKTNDGEQAEEQPKRGRKPAAKTPVEVPEETDAASSDVEAPEDEAVLEPRAAGPLDRSGRIVVFSLAGQRYAFPIECVQEIQQLVAFTDVPDPAPALVGMVNLRGLVVPLVDLRLLLGMEPLGYTLETPMIICRAHDEIVAVSVDEVEDVVEMPADCLQEPPRLHALGEKMIGVCRMEPELVFLLDLDSVMPRNSSSLGRDV